MQAKGEVVILSMEWALSPRYAMHDTRGGASQTTDDSVTDIVPD
jgi:hypothetical protein